MIITGDDTRGICVIQSILSQNFEMKNMGTLRYILCLEFTSAIDGYYLFYTKYFSNILLKVVIIDRKIVSGSLEVNAKLTTTECEPLLDATLSSIGWHSDLPYSHLSGHC